MFKGCLKKTIFCLVNLKMNETSQAEKYFTGILIIIVTALLPKTQFQFTLYNVRDYMTLNCGIKACFIC